ncbi:SWI/SNF complex component SNF12-like [Quillaja saponaria]|uniref:SWI/SNF complex component SNF12-like n=1 Tax=Quillaja saponaria TaxID=32244 RepID=A0AAD7KTG7_QUISA|nr:SWI/SNF complex component SNF12-like [Quillaja saponaria]
MNNNNQVKNVAASSPFWKFWDNFAVYAYESPTPLSQSQPQTQGSAKRPTHKPPSRPPSFSNTNTSTPFKTMELTPAVRRKKRKLPEKQIPEKVAAVLPESALFAQLVEFEARIDASLARKKFDLQESLRNPPSVPKTLRIYVYNTFENQMPTVSEKNNAEDPSWSLKITGRILENDNHVILWENARSPVLHEGFEVKRKGDREFNSIIRIEMNYKPEKFKLSTQMTEVLGIEIETRPRIIAALWHYVKARKLQNPNDPSFFICDPPLKRLFGEEKMKFSMVAQKISEHLSQPQHVHLEHKIKLCGSCPSGTACYDVLVDVPFPLEKDISTFLENTERHKEIDACDELICASIKKLHEHSRRRAFFLGFSHSPAEFINALISSQIKDLKLVSGDASRNAELEQNSDFYNQSWVEDAVICYLNRKSAGTDAPGRT